MVNIPPEGQDSIWDVTVSRLDGSVVIATWVQTMWSSTAVRQALASRSPGGGIYGDLDIKVRKVVTDGQD